MNSALQHQRGMSTVVLLLLVACVAFIGLFAVKVGPAYVEYLAVSKIAQETSENTIVMSQPPSKVLTHINKAYRTNNLWDLKADDTIKLTKKKGSYSVEVDYEKRINLFANIDVVSVFKKTAGSP